MAAQQPHVVLVLAADSSGSQHATAPLPESASLDGLLQAARQAFGDAVAQQELVLTDGQRNLSSDADVRQLRPGQRVLVRPRGAHGGAGGGSAFKERISFNPHPKTLTMAGDYEYFAAQGHHPLAFALAELIDNALRATKGNRQRPRRIDVSLVTDDKGSRGMVAVADNGSGMTTQELNNWAVMNLAMEDRGLLQPEEAKAGSRYLSSDISYFGVGSKNAAFYLGRTVKVVTRSADSAYVHELCIQAAELERRYREGQAVYEEDMLHRQPGDACSVAPFEAGFEQPQQLLAQELPGPGDGSGSDGSGDGSGCSSSSGSFTRVLIYELKPEVLAQLCEDDQGASILRDLAHLYHYYLHGPQGSTGTCGAGGGEQQVLPNGERLPEVVVSRLSAQGSVLWRKALVEVDDDLESRYLAAQRAKLEFVLAVPNHGKVEGVLWYFPYENDAESVPLDPHTMGRMLLMSNRDPGGGGGGSGATQHPGAGLTQLGGAASQLLPALTQRHGGTQGGGGGGAAAGKAQGMEPDAAEQEAAGLAALLAACPTFEAFWQGRLIPGACVDTLPFIRAVRSKRSAAARDVLPDEVFGRIRGALFFGPGFRVTRNKLTFRDNLALLLEGAAPTDRALEKRLRDWLIANHRQLDRTIRFEQMCSAAMQAQARKDLGADVTVFERIFDGVQSVARGDIVKLNTKPTTLGRVEHFSIPQVVHSEGCYSGGRITVCALPAEVLGPDNLHTWPLRRVECKATAQDLAEHTNKELAKLPASLVFEPMRLAADGVFSVTAGSSLPETSVSVLNGSKAKIVRALIGGRKQQLEVVQALYYLGRAGTARKRSAAAAAQLEAAAAAAGEAAAAGGSKKGGKRGGKRRKKAAAELAADKENEQPDGDAGGDEAPGKRSSGAGLAGEALDDPEPEGEVLLTVENKSPLGDVFQFQRIAGGLTRAGCYCLQYSLRPELPGGRTLRFSVDLLVTPGPAVAFDIRGEGRAIALSKSIMLGEALPPLHLVFTDAHGNAVPAAAGDAQPQLSLQVLEAVPGGGGAVLQELSAVADVDPKPDGVWLQSLRLLGPATGATGGMQLFKPAAAAAGGSAATTQHRATRGSVHCAAVATAASVTVPIVRAVDVYLAAHVDGMPAQGFALRLAPGAPHTVRLLDGHPFTPQPDGDEAAQQPQPMLTQLPAPGQQLAPAAVMSGEQLPTFKVQVLDAWGNATSPSEALPFEAQLQCAATEPTSCSFNVDERGVAVVSGVVALRRDTQPNAERGSQQPAAGAEEPQMHELRLWAQCEDCQQPTLQQALAAAEPLVPLALELAVVPSNRPAELLVLYKGEELGRRIQKSPDGDEDMLVWQLLDIEAGSVMDGLTVRCVDEAGRPATAGVNGKIKVSWAKGHKKATLGGKDIRLPAMHAPETAGHAWPYWVQFVGDPKEWPGVTLDIQFEVHVVPGPPASWSVAIVERYRSDTAAAAAAGKQGGDDGGGEDLSRIPCGRPFTLEIEALDACHNRCCFPSPDARPTPVVLAEPDDPQVALQLEPSAWAHKWAETQAGGEVCQFKMWLAGPPGPVKLIVRDEAGEAGTTLLGPDELTVELLPGPAAALVADCPQQLECGTRGLLDTLPIKAVDDWGNLVESAAFEIALNGSAFSVDSSGAARVAASGSNRTKLRGGVAAFKGVRVTAQEQGEYRLSVASVSRKVAVKEAAVTVKVAQQNIVCNLAVLSASLPAPAGSAGTSLALLVAVDTEDRAALPWEALTSGLSLSLAQPSPGDAADGGGGAAAGKAGKGGRGSGSKRQDVVQLTPECLWDEQQPPEGVSADAAAAAAEATQRGCVVCFRSPELTLAGSYTLTAEYREQRTELLPGLPKEDQHIRSTSQQFQLAAGPASTAVLQATGAEQEALSVSNGREPAARRLLRNAAVQLVDAHGNAAAAPGVPVRWRLLCAEASARADGAEAPQLACSAASSLQLSSDERGRAFFGDVGVEQDTGQMGTSGGTLQCTLEVQVLLPRSKSRRSSSSMSAASWVSVWTQAVMFCDDAARIRELQALQEQRELLQQQLGALKDSVGEVHQRVSTAQYEHKAACGAAQQRLQGLRTALRQPELALPASSKAAQKLLQQLWQQAAQEPQRPELAAAYGGGRHPMTAGISRLLQLNDADVVGVFAQLGYVDHAQLSAVLAANYASAMQVMVVKSYEAIARLRSAAQQAKVPVPSMLSYSLIQEFVPEPASCGPNTHMLGVTDLAQQLQADACLGTDAPLAIALPHTRQLSLLSSQGRALPEGLAANQWPPGCLGFAVNLIRPAHSNTRKSLMYAQLGRTLVFEGIDQAAAYRGYVCKTLRSTTADIVTLDGQKLSGRGVVLGSTFRVVPAADAPCRFGSVPRGNAATQASTTQREFAAEALVEALQQQEEAAAELAAAEAAAQQPEQQALEQQQADLQQQLRQLTEQIKQQQRSIEAGRAGGAATQRPSRGQAAEREVVEVLPDASEAAPTGRDTSRPQPRSKRRRT